MGRSCAPSPRRRRAFRRARRCGSISLPRAAGRCAGDVGGQVRERGRGPARLFASGTHERARGAGTMEGGFGEEGGLAHGPAKGRPVRRYEHAPVDTFAARSRFRRNGTCLRSPSPACAGQRFGKDDGSPTIGQRPRAVGASEPPAPCKSPAAPFRRGCRTARLATARS